jgi:hypothetical protein
MNDEFLEASKWHSVVNGGDTENLKMIFSNLSFPSSQVTTQRKKQLAARHFGPQHKIDY